MGNDKHSPDSQEILWTKTRWRCVVLSDLDLVEVAALISNAAVLNLLYDAACFLEHAM